MSRLATSFVLGYHGCELELARKVVARELSLAPSDTSYDWVGPGIYFWESDPLRAWEWANGRARDGDYDQPAVVGAIIDLRNCLDLLNRQDQELVKGAYDSLAELYRAAGRSMPKNTNAKKGGDKDRRARALDCDVIKHLHEIMDYSIDDDAETKLPHFDTVRGMFTEGEELYDGAAFYHQSHVQVAVRSIDCISGYFFPPEVEGFFLNPN